MLAVNPNTATHQARFFFLSDHQASGVLTEIPVERMLPDVDLVLEGDPYGLEDESVFDTNVSILRDVWRDLMIAHPEKQHMQTIYNVVVDVGVSKQRNGSGPSQPCMTLILQKP